jgi:hypothetical protein
MVGFREVIAITPGLLPILVVRVVRAFPPTVTSGWNLFGECGNGAGGAA